jgi:hypothetical protein
MSANQELIETIQELTDTIRTLNGSIESLEKHLDTHNHSLGYLGGQLDEVKDGLARLAKRL